MNSKLVMSLSAVFLVALGIVMNFMPQELAARMGFIGMPLAALMISLLAGFCLALGVMNWMLKDSQIGGIYGRPVSMANLLQFAVGAFALGRGARVDILGQWGWVLLVLYALFALAFAWLVFVGDSRKTKPASA